MLFAGTLYRFPWWSVLAATAPLLLSSMPACRLCGASLEPGEASCAYDVPLDHAPGIGDPAQIAKGALTHAAHEVHIARWRVHHPAERGATPQVMAWARETLAREGHIVPPT